MDKKRRGKLGSRVSRKVDAATLPPFDEDRRSLLQADAFLGNKPGTLYHKRYRREPLPVAVYRVGRRLWVRQSELIAYVESCREPVEVAA